LECDDGGDEEGFGDLILEIDMIKNLMLFVIVLKVFLININGQSLLSTETLLYSFSTRSGKTMILAKDKKDAYIVYRFGTKDKVELEVLDKTKKQFKYSFYLRGGGKANEGMDLNYVYFINKGFKYVVYSTSTAIDGKYEVGLKVIDLKTEKAINIKGKVKTVKGTLTDFRDNGLLEIGDELFD
jgi:hypothetical protein